MALLEAEGLSKSYGGNAVLQGVNLEVRAGEAVAIAGENGAGKSTLAKIITGVLRPDAGELRLEGRRLSLKSPTDALRQGIALIPQELAYVPDLTVAENLLLNRLPRKGWFTSQRGIHATAEAEVARFGLDVDVRKRMSDLRLAEQQMVEILKALIRRSQLIVLDEPTASLSGHESRELFQVLHRLKGEGNAFLYISHRLDEIRTICERVVVLRNGQLVHTADTSATSHELLIEKMLGSSTTRRSANRKYVPAGKPVLSLHDWRHDGQPRLEGIDLEVREGEVIGLYGVRGSGAELVAEGLAGRAPQVRGRITLDGQAVPLFTSPRASQAQGIGYVPAERKREGLVLSLSIQGNVPLLVRKEVARLGFVRPSLEHRLATKWMERLKVRAQSTAQHVGELSGGNQQKVLLASRLAARPRLLVLQEPTRGVDVGARVEIHRLLRDFAADGMTLLVVTSDVEEAVDLTDRLLVIRDGSIVNELTGERKTQSAVLQAAAGSAQDPETPVRNPPPPSSTYLEVTK